MEVEAEAESKATGEADVKAGLQRGGNEVVFFVLIETIPCPPHPHYSLIQDSDAVQLDVTIKEKDAAKMRPLHAESKSQDKYGLFSADAWIKKGGAKKKKKKGKESDIGAVDTMDSDGGDSTDFDVDVDEAEKSEDKEIENDPSDSESEEQIKQEKNEKEGGAKKKKSEKKKKKGKESKDKKE